MIKEKTLKIKYDSNLNIVEIYSLQNPTNSTSLKASAFKAPQSTPALGRWLQNTVSDILEE